MTSLFAFDIQCHYIFQITIEIWCWNRLFIELLPYLDKEITDRWKEHFEELLNAECEKQMGDDEEEDVKEQKEETKREEIRIKESIEEYIRGRSDKNLAYRRKTKILEKWRFISQHSLLLARYTWSSDAPTSLTRLKNTFSESLQSRRPWRR